MPTVAKWLFHFWSGSADMDFSIEAELHGIWNPGTYELSAFSQGEI